MSTLSKNKMAFIQLSVMMALTALTQIVNLFKTSVTASSFGATVQMDAFSFSNSIATFVFSFIGTGITTVLIPAILKKKDEKSINNFITILYGISLTFVFAIFIFRKVIISTLSTGSSEFLNVASKIMFIVLISQFFTTILSVTNAVFQCINKFNIPKVITFLTTSILTLLVVMKSNIDIFTYAYYILITNLLSVVIQCFIAYKEGFRYKPVLNFKDDNLKEMFRVFIPTMFSTGIYQISLLTDSMISSRLGEGQISMLSYSNTIMSMINMLLVANIMTYIYPKITRNINKDNHQKILFDYFTFLNVVMCLLVVGFVAIGYDGIEVLFQRGRFNSDVTQVVFTCALIYIIGLPINVMRDTIYRYFYAKGNTKQTFKNSVTASIVNIVVSIILSQFIGVYGIVLGTVITSIVSLTTILIRLRKFYGINYDKKKLLMENCKVLLSSIITLAIIFALRNYIFISNTIVSIIIFGILSVIIYIACLFVFRSKAHKIEF